MDTLTNDTYRLCPDCQYAEYNSHHVLCCGVDKIIGVKNFGCTPADITQAATFVGSYPDVQKRILDRLAAGK